MYLGPFSSVSKVNFKILTSIGALASTTSVASTSIYNNYDTFYKDVKNYSLKIIDLVKKHVSSYIDFTEINSIFTVLKTYWETLSAKIKSIQFSNLTEIKTFFVSFYGYLKYVEKIKSLNLKKYFSMDNFSKALAILKKSSSFIKQAFSVLNSGKFDLYKGFELLVKLLSDGSFLELSKKVFGLLYEGQIPLKDFNIKDLSEILEVFYNANKEGNLSEVIQRLKKALENWKPPFDKKSFIRQIIHGNTVVYFAEKLQDENTSTEELINEFLSNPKSIIVESIKDLTTDPEKTITAVADIVGTTIKSTIDSFFGLFS